MCYSAQLEAEWRTYQRYGGVLSITEFAQLYGHRFESKARIPKAVDAWFRHPQSAAEQEIVASIDRYNKDRLATWEAELFKQRKRLADAERTLSSKPTKKAENDKRVATNKVDQLLGWIADVKRTELKPRDARIYPHWYAPVIVLENGRRVIKPMRYLCRPAGKPAFYDTKYPGCYNARRDNLEGFWKAQFGQSHGVMLATAFFENVSRHRLEGRELRDGEEEENVVIQFKPQGMGTMLVACLWSHWTGPGEELLSFAAITDEPPAEVAAAGHDRCIIPIKEENVDAWLKGGSAADMYRILDGRERPYYEHRLAA